MMKESNGAYNVLIPSCVTNVHHSTITLWCEAG